MIIALTFKLEETYPKEVGPSPHITAELWHEKDWVEDSKDMTAQFTDMEQLYSKVFSWMLKKIKDRGYKFNSSVFFGRTDISEEDCNISVSYFIVYVEDRSPDKSHD